MSRRAVRAACLLGALAGCGGVRPSTELPADNHWSSAHFDYWTRAAEPEACPDILGPLEQHFATLQAYLGFTWPAGTKVAYYKFLDHVDLVTHGDCGDAGGCAPGSSVESPGGFTKHELVHAYLWPTGFPPAILVEGAAVALSCGAAFYTQTKPTVGWEMLAAYTEGPNDVYAPGAWLVGYLLDAYGPGPFLDLYATLPHDAGAADMDAAFESHYGKSLADIWAAALAEDQPRNTCIWECSGPPIALDDQPFATAGVCGVDNNRPFSLAAEATIAFTENGGTGMELGPCGPVTPPSNGIFANPTAVALYHLPAGRYYLLHGYAPGTIVGTADASATLNTDCASAMDASLLGDAGFFVAVPRGDAPWYLPLPPTTKQKLDMSYSGGGAAALCGSCAAGAACTFVGPGSVDLAGGEILRLTPDRTQPFSGFAPILF